MRNSIAKANRTIAWVTRSIISREPSVKLGLYKSLIKPHIEYCSQAWAPMARHGNWSLILELEGVQRSFTRMIDGIGLLTYRDRLDKLKLTTLLERRVRGDLIEMFKIQEGFVSCGSELFGRAGRTVAARSKPHRFSIIIYIGFPDNVSVRSTKSEYIFAIFNNAINNFESFN